MDLHDQIQAEIAKYNNLRVEIDRKLSILGDVEATTKKKAEAETLLKEAHKIRQAADEYAVRVRQGSDLLISETKELKDKAQKYFEKARDDQIALEILRSREQYQLNEKRAELNQNQAAYSQKLRELRQAQEALTDRKKTLDSVVSKIVELAKTV